VLFERFLERANLPADVSPREVVDTVQAIPYGRPTWRTPAGVLVEWRGTCSTKHALLAGLLAERWPQLRPRLAHRRYRAQRADVQRRHGAQVAAVVPPGGLMDVHRYMVIELGGRAVVLDVTFPNDARWDGRSSMPVACGPGEDVAAGADPDADKRALEARWCDPAVREPFITALGRGAVEAGGPASSG
jgi:hypothetical protein